MSLLAKSCYAPGIIALISNLIMSSAIDEDAELDGEAKSIWMSQYEEGLNNEFYRNKLSLKMENKTMA